LHKQPFKYYLEEGEEPAYLYDTIEPVSVSRSNSESELVPDKRYRTIIGFTDRRLLVVVGQKPNNRIEAIQWNHVNSFGIKPKSLSLHFPESAKPELPSTEVNFEFSTSERTIRFDSNTEYDPNNILDSIAPFLVRRTGVDQWEGKTKWERCRENYQEAEKEYKTKKERERREQERKRREYERLAARGKGSSVTPDVVEETLDQLQENEQPHYYIRGDKHYHQIKNRDSQGPSEQNNLDWALFTNERIIIHYSSDIWRIPYTEIVGVDAVEREIIQEYSRWEEGEERIVEEPVLQRLLEVETPVGIHLIEIGNLSQRELTELISYVRTNG
jgi:hypothetical protein